MKKLVGLMLVFMACCFTASAQEYDVAVQVSYGTTIYSTSVPLGSTYLYFEQDSATDAAIYYEPSMSQQLQDLIIAAVPRGKKPPRLNGYTSVKLNCFDFDGFIYADPFSGKVCGYYYISG
jgi:hypothetical protein